VPELPEVETIRRTLEARVLGRTIRQVKLWRADMVHQSRAGDGAWIRRGDRRRARNAPGALLKGETIEALERRGKQLAIVSRRGPALVVHLGMTGQLVCTGTGDKDRKHVHIEWTLSDGARLIFRDPRRFGAVGVFVDRAALERAWDTLGPDAAAIGASELRERLRWTRRAIKCALLDQHVIAGIGNIYADEALFEARIRPRRVTSRLKDEEVERLARAIRDVLARAIEAKGSTLRDYVDGSGKRGGFQLEHRVYGRAGLACVRCSRRLKSEIVAQRTTVWCGACQR